jgi:hypothetical protein
MKSRAPDPLHARSRLAVESIAERKRPRTAATTPEFKREPATPGPNLKSPLLVQSGILGTPRTGQRDDRSGTNRAVSSEGRNGCLIICGARPAAATTGSALAETRACGPGAGLTHCIGARLSQRLSSRRRPGCWPL